MSGADRYVAQYHASKAGAGDEIIPPPSSGRMVLLTLAFTPMVAVGALPLTAVLAGVAAFTANAASSQVVGLAMLVAAELGLGYAVARVAAGYQGVPKDWGWQRWLPLAATIAVVGSGLTEIASGSRAPDPVIALWVAAVVWMVVFLPLAGGVWGASRRALWTIAPLVTLATIVFVGTHGLFAWRFPKSVPALDATAARVVAGDRIEPGTHAGAFAVYYVTVGHIGRNDSCDVGFWITGWHAEDTRYIAHCRAAPEGRFVHLSGDWWQLEGMRPPADL